MKRLHLKPLGENLLVETGATLLSTLLSRQMNVKMSCGGRGFCSTCRVSIKQGMDQLSPIENRERKTLSLVAGVTSECRLACQSRVEGEGIIVEVPKGMYIERAEDLLSLLGQRAPENILHPIHGSILIPKDKIITRSLLEQSRTLEKEVERMKNRAVGAGESDSQLNSSSISNFRFMATGSGLAPSQGLDSFTSTSILNLTTRMDFSKHASKTGNPSAPSFSMHSSDQKLPTIHAEESTLPPYLTRPERKAVVLEPGATVGKFLLLEEIGKGGVGLVYRALHTKLKSIVAMKFLKPSSPGGTGALLERFGNEARLLAQLNHPNVVRVLDFEDNSALPYVVMEFVDGSSASELLKQQGRLPLAKVLSILSQATRGLMAALHLGIIHRDVKPANILVDKLGIAKLVDLGLAVQMQSDDGTELGKGRGAEGTAGYMSPEQLQDGSSIDHRSDIYSLGVTFYHLLTGRLPFTGSNRNEVFFKHMTATPTAPHEICPDVPVEVSQIILKMMEKHPLDRPQTYEEVLALWDTVAGNAKELARSAK